MIELEKIAAAERILQQKLNNITITEQQKIEEVEYILQ